MTSIMPAIDREPQRAVDIALGVEYQGFPAFMSFNARIIVNDGEQRKREKKAPGASVGKFFPEIFIESVLSS
jgi:hypothetical protein